jgi:uncharacterized membrane protein
MQQFREGMIVNRFATKKLTANKIVLNGLMIAMTFLATYFTHIPTPVPGGYFNLGDAVILTAAVLMGKTSGVVVGAIGSCLADVAYGAFIFAPVTFVVKGLEGLAAGVIARKSIAAAAGLGSVVMIAGYFLAEALILGLIDNAFGFAAAYAELFPNLLQGAISAVVAYILSALISKHKLINYSGGN